MMKSIKFLIVTLLLFSCGLLAQPPKGYYSGIEGKNKSVLKTALKVIVYPARTLRYGKGKRSTWEGFYQTDRKADGSVLDRYSNNLFWFGACGESVKGMHIEHSLPKSWWGGARNEAFEDLHHLFPSDGPTNSAKNNHPLGICRLPARNDNGVSRIGKNGFGDEYEGTCFEPAEGWKGDFARAYLYIATTYEELSQEWNSPMMDNNTYPLWKEWAIVLLMKWHKDDPVSKLERDRMEQVFLIQGNRNPYIDYPELVDHVWGVKKELPFRLKPTPPVGLRPVRSKR